MKRVILLAIVFAALCGCQHDKTTLRKDDVSVINADDGNFNAPNADVEGLDDSLENKVIIKVGNTGGVFTGGKFFRGYVDKTTKAVEYQFYTRFNSPNPMNWDRSRYLSTNGLKELSTSRAGLETRCNAYRCGYFEDVVIQLDRPTLEQWKQKETTLRISSSTVSGSQDVDVSDGDAKDFLNAMDAVVAYLGRKRLSN